MRYLSSASERFLARASLDAVFDDVPAAFLRRLSAAAVYGRRSSVWPGLVIGVRNGFHRYRGGLFPGAPLKQRRPGFCAKIDDLP